MKGTVWSALWTENSHYYQIPLHIQLVEISWKMEFTFLLTDKYYLLKKWEYFYNKMFVVFLIGAPVQYAMDFEKSGVAVLSSYLSVKVQAE